MAKWREPVRRPYYAKYERVPLAHDQGWYECYRLPGDVLAVCEPGHLQEVNVFLLPGADRALLIDTGTGMANIRPVIDELWQGELVVVNTHFHFDHTGGAHAFDEVLASVNPLVERQAREGIPHRFLENQVDEDMFLWGYPPGFDPRTFAVAPYSVRPVEDGAAIDLGGRVVDVVHTPGHTQDSLMLYDRASAVLFGGDMLYYGAIYVQFDNDFMGHSSVEGYVRSLERVKERFPYVKAVYASHNDFVMDPRCIDDILAAMRAVRDGRAERESMNDASWAYYGDELPLSLYRFRDFTVIAK